MIDDRLDLAMRVGEITDASVIARRIGIAARVVVAAPSYLQRHGIPSEPRDLAQHICIVREAATAPRGGAAPGGSESLERGVAGRGESYLRRGRRITGRWGCGSAAVANVTLADSARFGRVSADGSAAALACRPR
jgi:hypothetical protein